ncbi:MAG TPA: M28 family metallopeptidase [Vicinamibacterales bacterium]|nr:M28 family metallopeptidase [Vicinamibacterales bacterium]
MKRAALIALLAAAACSTPGSLTLSQLPDIDTNALLQHVKVLSSDEFEGRAPGSRGEELTVAYLVDQFKKIGLKPGNTDGTYIQKVPLVGITAAPAPLVVTKGAKSLTLKFRDDVVAATRRVTESASLDKSELVFVGYGVVAPEYNWDDYKGLDVRGKTLVMLVGDPPVPDPAKPGELDPKMFGGKAMTYYGRWTYKYEIGAMKGAAGVLIVHETAPASYAFNVVQDSFTGEQFNLVTPDKNMGRASVEGWIPYEQAVNVFKLAGQDYDALKKQALSRDFRPVPLGVDASMTIRSTIRTIDSQNVVGKIDGADPARKDEYVVYTAHWDHLGKSNEGIFHGAVDNASGTASLLELARAFEKVSPPPKRSILFVSVTAEEKGLLGSEYYAVAPIYPLAKTLANINIDGINVHGRTKDLTLVGYGASDLDDYAVEAAKEQGRSIRPDPEPEKGGYYRSDHFSFAKRGVPALDPDEGVDFVGRPADYGRRIREEYNKERYHSPKDVITPDWDLSGAAEDLKLLLAVGYRVAQAQKFPEWKAGNEFKAIREKSLGSDK